MTNRSQPLSELIRPQTLLDFFGQDHLVNLKNGTICNFIRVGYLPSMILYGPPGVGKTTLASIISEEAGYVFVELSATESTVDDLRELSKTIKGENRSRSHKFDALRVAVFIDEIHRFSKNQQDFLLPLIEDGSFVFIGATTVNPSKRIQRAILSRCQQFELFPLGNLEAMEVVKRAIAVENTRRRSQELGDMVFEENSIEALIEKCEDIRMAINLIELISARDRIVINPGESKCDAAEAPLIHGESKSTLVNTEVLNSSIERLRVTQSVLGGEKNKELYDDLLNTMWTCAANRKCSRNTDHRTQSSIETSKPSVKYNNKDIQTIGHSLGYSRSRLSFTEFLKCQNCIPKGDQPSYFQQMQLSDDSEIETEYDSDDIDDETSIVNNLSYSDEAGLELCLVKLLKLMQMGESQISIGKRLVLYMVAFTDANNASIKKVLSNISSLGNTSMDAKIVLSQCIEWIIKLRIHEEQFWTLDKHKSERNGLPSGSTAMNKITVDFNLDILTDLLSEKSDFEILEEGEINHLIGEYESENEMYNIGEIFE